MEIAVIAIALLTAVSLIFGGIKLNAYSHEKYNYEPINILTILAMTIPFILLFLGFIIFNDATNKWLSIVFSLTAAAFVFMYILNKTDEEVAFAATVILLFAGLVLLMIAANTRSSHYYYDD